MERGIWKMEFGRWNLEDGIWSGGFVKRNPPVFQGISVHKSPRGFRYTNPQKIGVLTQKKISHEISEP